MNNKKNSKGKTARYWIIGLITILVAAVVFLRFSSVHARSNNSSARSVGTVTTLNVAQTITASGSLAAEPSANLTWNTSGVVDQVNVKAGQKVKAGDVLMKLKANSVSSSIISAQSDLVTAQESLQTAQSGTSLAQAAIDLKTAQDAYTKAQDYLNFLLNSQQVPQTSTQVILEAKRNGWQYVPKVKDFKGPAPQDWIVTAQNDLALKKGQLQDAQNTYDRLKAGQSSPDVAAAQAKVDAAQATVDSMSIIAPFDGQVLFVNNQPGDSVSSGAAAANMANLDHLYVDAQVDESDIANVKVGDKVTATLDAVPGLTLTGQVAMINPVGTVASGLVKYTVRVEFNKADTDLSLPLGATVNVSIQVRGATSMLAVPVTAIQNDSKGEYVWAIHNGAPVRVNIVGGQIVGTEVAVTGDLKPGELVQLGQSSSNTNRGPFRFFGGGGRGG